MTRIAVPNKKLVTNYIIYFSLTLLGLYMSVFQRSLNDISNFLQVVGLFSGLLVTVHFTGIFLMPLLAGELADKYGRKLVACFSFSLLFFGLLISLISKNVVTYLIGVFFVGGGFGVVEGMMTTLLVDMNKENEARVINISQAFFCLGALVGPLLTSYFISLGYSWRTLYGIFAIISGLYILYFWRLPMAGLNVSAVEKIKGTIVFKLIRQPVLILLAVTMFMYVGVEQGVAFLITNYTNSVGDSILFPSVNLSLFWGLMIAGRIIIGLLRKSYRVSKLVIGLTLFSFISLVLVLLSNGYLSLAISFSLLGLGLSAIWPLIMVLSNKFFTRYHATAFGIMMASSALGGMVLPFISGFIGNAYNIRAGIGFFILPLITMVVLQWIVLRKYEKF